MIIISILLSLILTVNAHAIDKKLGSSNSFKITITDATGNGIAGLDVATPFSDFAVKIKCGGDAIVTMDESGDTVVDEGGGVYYITTNDTLTTANENECLVWAVGEGSYVLATATPTSLIAKTPRLIKAVGATMDAVIGTLTGTVTTGSCTNTATQFDTTRTDAGINRWRDSFLTFAEDTATSELRSQTKPIVASDPNGCITVRSPGFTTIPQPGDAFFIINK